MCVDRELSKEMQLHIAQTCSVPVTAVDGRLCVFQSIKSLENSQISILNDLIEQATTKPVANIIKSTI